MLAPLGSLGTSLLPVTGMGYALMAVSGVGSLAGQPACCWQ